VEERLMSTKSMQEKSIEKETLLLDPVVKSTFELYFEEDWQRQMCRANRDQPAKAELFTTFTRISEVPATPSRA
jgi:hypothetical protein